MSAFESLFPLSLSFLDFFPSDVPVLLLTSVIGIKDALAVAGGGGSTGPDTNNKSLH